jgi:hypothetical protein
MREIIRKIMGIMGKMRESKKIGYSGQNEGKEGKIE